MGLGALSRVLWHTAWRPVADWRLRALVTAHATAQKRFIEAEHAFNAAATKDRADELEFLRQTEFETGYREGVADALDSTNPGTMSMLVRKAAMGRVVTWS